ncbi:MAG: hypothetical protein AM326_07345 [Candidatus Thorarchaeota archaeon SMTZ-45]|nr:MAG: hypothetical protein AM325_02755 [Candidatus Thorarchaeota archaeon SMTZ1-45]KXH76313.1 MAG: hypothetical protein AM326_07345 [Candidatus Thorarchaeota archaeon SMTZ-45]
MGVLEYLLVYTESGLPIYSKCYGTFCKTAFRNPELLSGFLSALQTLPLTISSELSLEAVKLGPTQMRFSKSIPSGHSIVVGMGEDKPEVAERIFEDISKILAADRFLNVDWSYITSDIMNDFEKVLLKSTLVNALKDHGGFEDQCSLGDQCPIHTNALLYKTRREKVWSLIKGKYAALRERMRSKE